MSNKINSNLKFSDIDILSFMNKVLLKHTKHYQSDFLIDRKILRKAAKYTQEEKTFIWLCRESGTWLLAERYTLLKNTQEFNTFSFYAKHTNDTVLAFLIEVKDIRDGLVIGNIYVQNYLEYYNHICSLSDKYDTTVLPYTDNYHNPDAGKIIDRCSQIEYDELSKILLNERHEREQYQEGNPDEYLASL